MRYCYIGVCQEDPSMLGGTLQLLKMPQQKLLLQLFVYTHFAIFHFFGPQKREFVLDLHFYHQCPQAKQHTTEVEAIIGLTCKRRLFRQWICWSDLSTHGLLGWSRVHNFPIYHNYPQNVKYYGFCLSEIIYCYIQAYLFSD